MTSILRRAMASRMIARQECGIFPPGGAMPSSSVLASGTSSSFATIGTLPVPEQIAARLAGLRGVEQRDHFVPAIADDARRRLAGMRFGMAFGQNDDATRA